MENLPDDLQPVQKLPDDLQPVNAPAAPVSEGGGQPIEGPVANVIFSRGKLAALSKAFGTGWTEGFGPDPVGLSPETSKEMATYGLLYDRKVGGPPTVLNSFGEAFLRPAFGAIGTAIRAFSGAARAIGDTALEAGVPRDIVAMPGMWQAGPLGLGKVSFRPGLGKDVRADVPIEKPADLKRPATSEAVSMEALHSYNSSTPFMGFRALENVPDDIRYDGGGGVFGRVTYLDPTGKWAKGEQGALGHDATVRVQANFDKLYTLTPDRISDLEKIVGKDAMANGETIAAKLREKGYDGIHVKGFDDFDGQIPAHVDGNIFQDQVAVFNPEKSLTPKGNVEYPARPAAGASRAEQDAYWAGRSEVVDREMGALNREKVTDLDAAAELGVIGDPKPTAFEMPREQPKVMAAERAPEGDLVRRSDVLDNPAVDKAGNIRLDLIETSDDAAKVIRAAAEANHGYMPARQGEISLTHQEQLSQVLGIPVADLPLKGIGRRLQNDADLRVSIQGMVQSAEQVTQLAKQAHLSNDPKDLIKFQEAWMRHDILQETVSGLTAEWGRTGNVFQEFRERVKDTRQLGEFLKEKRGRSVEDLRDLASKISSLEPSQVPNLLANARRQNFWDKLHYYWVNSILSGQFSQATYLISDAMFAVYDNVAIKPVAGVVGAIRGGDVPRAFIGEGAAGLYGYISGVPEGLRAAWEVLKTGEHSVLPREVSTGMKNPVTEQRPIGGFIGTTVGLPSRELSMIHAVQSNMAYRSQLTSLAYREAAKSGHAPWSAEFRQELRGKLEFPTEAMMDEAVTYSQRMTFTDPITGAQKAVKDFARNVPGMRYLIPFTNVPMNTLNAAIEGTPLSFLNDKMRANLKGENGKVAQDTQIARLAVGSTVMGMASYWALNGDITGNGPVNPEDRAIWLLTHAPNSVRIGSNWVSFEKFAPLGTLFGMAADLVEAGRSGVDDKEWGQAAGHLAVAASNMLLNNTGMKGLSDLSEAIRAKDVEKSLTRYANNFAASFSPFSSATGQFASMMDPNMREAKTLVEAFQNKIPKLREDLFPVRDWSGIPRANTRAEWGALFKSEHVNKDPIDNEMADLNIKMDKVKQYIGEVKLTPAQYDAYQNLAGVTTRSMLNSLISQDGWYQVPAFAREEAIRKVIASARRYASSAIQAQSVGTADDIVRQGVQLKLDALQK